MSVCGRVREEAGLVFLCFRLLMRGSPCIKEEIFVDRYNFIVMKGFLHLARNDKTGV